MRCVGSGLIRIVVKHDFPVKDGFVTSPRGYAIPAILRVEAPAPVFERMSAVARELVRWLALRR